MRNHNDNSAALSGDLRHIALSDIIQIVANDARPGVIWLDAPQARGAIWFEAGQIVRAELGARAGDEAFYAAMTLAKGQFMLVFDVICAAPNVEASIFGMLMEGARRIDECNRIRASLDTDSVDLVTVGEATAEDLAIAYLFTIPCSADLVVSRCPMGELEAYAAIARLVESGALAPVARTPLAA